MKRKRNVLKAILMLVAILCSFKASPQFNSKGSISLCGNKIPLWNNFSINSGKYGLKEGRVFYSHSLHTLVFEDAVFTYDTFWRPWPLLDEKDASIVLEAENLRVIIHGKAKILGNENDYPVLGELIVKKRATIMQGDRKGELEVDQLTAEANVELKNLTHLKINYQIRTQENATVTIDSIPVYFTGRERPYAGRPYPLWGKGRLDLKNVRVVKPIGASYDPVKNIFRYSYGSEVNSSVQLEPVRPLGLRLKGQQITTNNIYKEENGVGYFNMLTNTLELEDLNLTSTHSIESELDSLTILLKGNNVIQSEHGILFINEKRDGAKFRITTKEGKGTLRIKSDRTALSTAGFHKTNMIIDGNTHIQAEGAVSGVFMESGGSLVFENPATLRAKGAADGSIYEMDNLRHPSSYAVTVPRGGQWVAADRSVQTAGGTIAKDWVHIEPLISYPLSIDGVEVTTIIADDILNDGGSMRYVPETKTLYLKNTNFTATNKGAIISKISGLTIDVTGACTLSATTHYTILDQISSSELQIQGSGTLTLNNTSAWAPALGIASKSKLTVYNELTVNGSKGGIEGYTDSELILAGSAVVNATGNSAPSVNVEELTLKGGVQIVTPAGAYFNGTHIVDPAGNPIRTTVELRRPGSVTQYLDASPAIVTLSGAAAETRTIQISSNIDWRAEVRPKGGGTPATTITGADTGSHNGTITLTANGNDTEAERVDSVVFINTATDAVADYVLVKQSALTIGLTIGGTQVTAANAPDILGDGKVSYDPATKELRLNNANIGPSYYGMETSIDGLRIVLTGTNTITAEKFGIDLEPGSSTTITGAGRLDINATGDSGIGIYMISAPLTINGGSHVTATGKSNGIQGEDDGIFADILIVDGATLETTGTTDGSIVLYDGELRIMGGSQLYEPEGAEYNAASGSIMMAGDVVTTKVVIGPPPTVTPNLVVTPASFSISSEEAIKVVQIRSNVIWNVQSSDAWLIPNTSTGSNNNDILVQISANTETMNRTATLTITDGASITRTVTVTQKGAGGSGATSVSGVRLNETSLTLDKGESYMLTHTVLPLSATNQDVTWSSSNTSVATVSAGGKVQAISPGVTLVSVITDEGGYAASCAVLVRDEAPSADVKVTQLTMNRTAVDIDMLQTFQLAVTVTPATATNKRVMWSSSNPIAASVEPTGLVTIHRKGEARITATALDGSGKTATCDIRVLRAVANEMIEGVRVYAHGGALHFTLPAPQTVYLYDVNGALMKTLVLAAGDHVEPMPAGACIVRIGHTVRKMMVK